MTYRLRFSDKALDDLSGIGGYLKATSGSDSIADGFVEQLIVRCESLADLPGTLGRDRSDLRSGMRSWAFKNYVFFFRYLGDVLEVVTILEGHRDIDTFFRDE